jgi:hypothetical protein
MHPPQILSVVSLLHFRPHTTSTTPGGGDDARESQRVYTPLTLVPANSRGRTTLRASSSPLVAFFFLHFKWHFFSRCRVPQLLLLLMASGAGMEKASAKGVGDEAFGDMVFVEVGLGAKLWECLQNGIHMGGGVVAAAATPTAAPTPTPTHVVVRLMASKEVRAKAQNAYPNAEIVTQQWVSERRLTYANKRKVSPGAGGGSGGSGSGGGGSGGGGGPSSSSKAAKFAVVATPASASNRSVRYDSDTDEEWEDNRNRDRKRRAAAAAAGPREAGNNAAGILPATAADVDDFPADHPNWALLTPPKATEEDHTLYGRTPGKPMGAYERVMRCMYDAGASLNEDIVVGALYSCSIHLTHSA